MRHLIDLTDDQLEAKFETLGYGLCEEDLAYTRATIDDFKAGRHLYAHAGCVVTDANGIYELKSVQTAKGAPRFNVVVIDCGEIRAVYCDLPAGYVGPQLEAIYG